MMSCVCPFQRASCCDDVMRVSVSVSEKCYSKRTTMFVGTDTAIELLHLVKESDGETFA